MKKKNYRIVHNHLTHDGLNIHVLKETIEWSDIIMVDGYVKILLHDDADIDIDVEHKMIHQNMKGFNPHILAQHNFTFEGIDRLLYVLNRCEIIEWGKEHAQQEEAQ